MNSGDIQKYIKSLEDRIAEVENGNFVHVYTPNPDDTDKGPGIVTVEWGGANTRTFKVRRGSFYLAEHRNVTARDYDGAPMMFGPTEVEMKFISRSK
jgi:hypothetical protein